MVGPRACGDLDHGRRSTMAEVVGDASPARTPTGCEA